MQLLDREMQLKLLQRMSKEFPEPLDSRLLMSEFDHEALSVNIAYLEGHGLMEAHWARPIAKRSSPVKSKITARGLDFLADDGGLSAILGVVTVRLHEDTVKALLIERIESSEAPETVKSKLVAQVRALPAEATKMLTLDALKSGLSSMPDLIQWLSKVLG